MRRNVKTTELHDVTPSKFAVDRRIEHRKVSLASLHLEARTDRSDVLGNSGGLGPTNLPVIQGSRLAA